ncbi:hypothetical protein T12_1698 [Trichinella patagoniensis]|uniref:Uncharacterized protein n=1 Tax=Trichinella patagoniensis TaxID=990121 RepID=A0A0V0Z7S0_9BILA|nr:hypothetical protein T12_1698 [Trichinella patagoniensis]
MGFQRSTHSFRCLNPFGERWVGFFNLQRIPKRFLNHSHDPFPISTCPWSCSRRRPTTTAVLL